MKIFASLLVLLLGTSCEYATLKYGYYWNPLKVAEVAYESIENNRLDLFTEVLSGKAMCTYGSKEGMNNLRRTLPKIDESTLNEPVLVSSEHLKRPQYIGYYAYFQQKYVSRALDKSGKTLLKVTILCHFGADDFKKDLINAPVSKYGIRSCSIVSILNLDAPINVPDFCHD